MGFMFHFILGLILVLFTCSSVLEGAQYHHRQPRQVKDDKVVEQQNVHHGQTEKKVEGEGAHHRSENIVTNLSREEVESSKPKTDINSSNNSSNTDKLTSSLDVDVDRQNKIVPSRVVENNDSISTKLQQVEESSRTKSSREEAGRSLDVGKYYSEEFHNKNNVYTLPSNPDTEKYISPDYDQHHSSTYQLPDHTVDYFSSELTTPKSPLFDSRYKETVKNVDQTLEHIDDGDHDLSLDQTQQHQEHHEVSVDKLYDEAKNNGNGTEANLNYISYKNILKNDTGGKNSLHKDLVVEAGSNVNFASSYNDTKIIDESPDDHNNTIVKEHLEEGNRHESKNGTKGEPSENSEVSTAKTLLVPTTRKSTILTKPPSSRNDSHISILSNKIEAETVKSVDLIRSNSIVIPVATTTTEQPKGESSPYTRRTPADIGKRGSTKYADYAPSFAITEAATSRYSRSRTRAPDGPRNTSSEQQVQENQIIPVHVEPPGDLNATVTATSTEMPTPSTADVTNSTAYSTTSYVQTTTAAAKPTTHSPETTTGYPQVPTTTLQTTTTTTVEITTEEAIPTTTDNTDEATTVTTTTSRTTAKSGAMLAETTTGRPTDDYTTVDPTVETTTVFIAGTTPPPVSEEPETTTTVARTETASIDTEGPATTTEAALTTTVVSADIAATTTEQPAATTSVVADLTTIVPEATTVAADLATVVAGSTTMYASEATTTITTENGVRTSKGMVFTTPEVVATTEGNNNNPTTMYASEATTTITTETGVRTSKVMVFTTPEVVATTEENNNNNPTTTVIYEIEETTPLVVSNVDKIEANCTGSAKSTKIPKNLRVNEETTTANASGTTDSSGLSDDSGDNSGTIAAIVISSIGAVCLILLAGLLYIMKKRQKRFNYGQRCRPAPDYRMDNISVYNSVRRKAVVRSSKRSYGNPAFEDPVSVSHPLNFPAVVKFASNLDDIKAEFAEVPQIQARTNELPEGCDAKNRYANVIPLPETRVFLVAIDGYPNSDYINANYVTGPKNIKGYYIACQAPMQSTVDDFWRMIWEQQSKVVLMLTHLFENGTEKCIDYLPPSEVLDCHRLFGDFQITLKKREVKESYIISTIQLKNMVSNSWREVTHLWYLGWPDKGVPAEANSLIAFLIEARSYMKSSLDKKDATNGNITNGNLRSETNPVVVHCSPGTGRTGTVIACDIAIREFEQNRLVDIPTIVYRIRRDRASSVQTKEQYEFIYKVVSVYATKLTGGALDSF